MPLELQVIRASEFVRLGAENHFDFDASKEALRLLARACWKRGLKRALLDLRALPVPPKPIFTPPQLAALVETFSGAGFTRHHRLAVLYRVDQHGGARRFAFIGRRQGWQVEAFDDFEKALHWLSVGDEESMDCAGEEIPIKVAKSSVKSVKSPISIPVRRGRYDRV